MLEITNLHATVDGKAILKGIDLTIQPGEMHAIMGPNGSGKSTLAYILSGRDGYEVTEGQVRYEGRDLLVMAPEERAAEGDGVVARVAESAAASPPRRRTVSSTRSRVAPSSPQMWSSGPALVSLIGEPWNVENSYCTCQNTARDVFKHY